MSKEWDEFSSQMEHKEYSAFGGKNWKEKLKFFAKTQERRYFKKGNSASLELAKNYREIQLSLDQCKLPAGDAAKSLEFVLKFEDNSQSIEFLPGGMVRVIHDHGRIMSIYSREGDLLRENEVDHGLIQLDPNRPRFKELDHGILSLPPNPLTRRELDHGYIWEKPSPTRRFELDHGFADFGPPKPPLPHE